MTGRVGLRSLVARAVVVVVVLGLLLFVGRYAPLHPMVSLGIACIVLFVGLVAIDLTLVPALALPFMLIGIRVGSGSGLTISDAVLAVASLPALLYVSGGVSRLMRQAMWLGVLYQVSALFTVLNNPYQADIVEWFHVVVLVLGALIAGWTIGRSGRARLAVNLAIAIIGIIAVGALVSAARQYAGGDFTSVYPSLPYPMHKNAAGSILALGALMLYVRPPWMEWTRRWSLAGFWLFAAALATTQSRQAIIGLTVALGILVLRRTTVRRRSKAILLMLVPAATAVSVMVRDQVESGNEFNSFFQRIDWFGTALDVWRTDPWFGVGMRWWYTDRFPVQFQPPNAILETLTSNGVVGLAAFLALLIGTLVIAHRLDPAYGVLAQLVLIQRLVSSQFDLFWVSIQVSLPFAVLGLCLGVAARHEDVEQTPAALRAKVARAVGQPVVG